MAEHYNLYYLFLEDKQRHPMPEEKYLEIRKDLEKFYQKIKPPWISLPPNITRDTKLHQNNK